jgi:hypothetical protein
LSYIDIDGAVNVNVELNLSILTVVASARNFREMRSDDRFEPIPVNCHCANQCPQLANAFRTRTEQECALKVAFGTFAKPSTNARSLREAVRSIGERRAGVPGRLDLTALEHKVNIMHGRPRPPRLLSVCGGRIACRVCSRSGSYRLARLAAKYGPEITLRDLTERFSYDCLWRAEPRSKKGKSACGVYLPDLEHKRPPDLPPGMVNLRLVKGD